MRNETWLISLVGPPDGGSFDIHIPINGVTEAITFDFDMDAAAVKTALEGHTELEATDISTVGGPWPESSINIEFIGDQKGTSIIPTRIDKTALTSSEGLGIDVAIYRWSPGYPD